MESREVAVCSTFPAFTQKFFVVGRGYSSAKVNSREVESRKVGTCSKFSAEDSGVGVEGETPRYVLLSLCCRSKQ